MERYILFWVDSPSARYKEEEGNVNANAADQDLLIAKLFDSVTTIVERQHTAIQKHSHLTFGDFPGNYGIKWAALSSKEMSGSKPNVPSSTKSWTTNIADLNTTLSFLLNEETNTVRYSEDLLELTHLYELLDRLPSSGSYTLDLVCLAPFGDVSLNLSSSITELFLRIKLCHDGAVTIISNSGEESTLVSLEKLTKLKIIPPNNLNIYPSEQLFESELFWRGNLLFNIAGHEPFSSPFMELHFFLDELDKILQEIEKENETTLVPRSRRVYFDRVLEAFALCDSLTVPDCFATGSSLVLRFPNGEEIFSSEVFQSENLAVMFRLAYSFEGPLREAPPKWTSKERAKPLYEDQETIPGPAEPSKDTNYLYFFSTVDNVDGQQKLILNGIKNPEQMQELANAYFSLPPQDTNSRADPMLRPLNCVSGAALCSVEKKVRSLQAETLKLWLQSKTEEDPEYKLTKSTADEILAEVETQCLVMFKNALLPASTELESYQDENFAEILHELEPKDWPERRALEQRLRKAQQPIFEAKKSGLLAPRRNTAIISTENITRHFDKQGNLVTRLPSPAEPKSKNSKPNVSLDQLKQTKWPDILQCKYHGISYNVNKDSESAEQRKSKLQEKCVTDETDKNRTPRKNAPASTNEALRKSPRLLAKTQPASSGVSTRSKKTETGKNPSTPKKNVTQNTFKDNLKAVIVRALNEEGLDPSHTLFRTCANKLSVICRTLLRGTDPSSLSARQMYRVARDNAKQVVNLEMKNSKSK